MTNQIEGIWIRGEYSKPNITYNLGDSLTADNLNFKIEANGRLIRVQPVGGCGTEPIEYEKVNGTWLKVSDTTFSIEFPYWDGIGKELYYIKEVNKNILILELLEQTSIKK